MEFLGNGNDPYLLRAQPGGEQAGIFLNQPCQRSLIASHRGSVDNAGTLLVTVLINIVHVKLLRQQGVPLDGNHGVFLAIHVFGIDIHLGSVEGRLSHILHKRNV